MPHPATSRPGKRFRVVASVVRGAFTDFLREQGLAPKTIAHACWAVRHAAKWHARNRRALPLVRSSDLPALFFRTSSPTWCYSTRKVYRAGMRWWLRFHGLYPTPDPAPQPAYPWSGLLDDYLEFLKVHRGLLVKTCIANRSVIRSFLRELFGLHPPDWERITPEDIWRYARHFQRGRKPGTLNQDLARVRAFLEFVLMRGTSVAHLIHAVPRFFNFGNAPQIQVLDDDQYSKLIAAFDRRSPRGARDYALVRCMVDLGLRPGEAMRLSLSDLHWSERRLSVPPFKGGRGRQLPMPKHIEVALREYIQRGRAPTESDRLFIRDTKTRYGTPLEIGDLQAILAPAFRRCGFPEHWTGCYRLRHTFATRLHARGVGIKQIADLLGHRRLQTTTLYAKVDLNGLRDLALVWPL